MSKLLLRSGSRVPVRLEANFPDQRLIGGKYQMAAHSITLYQETIKKQCLQLFGCLDRLEDYITVILAHEMGHAEDTELGRLSSALDGELPSAERNRIMLQIEVNAWQYARSLLAEETDSAFLNTIVMESLAVYREDVPAEALVAEIA